MVGAGWGATGAEQPIPPQNVQVVSNFLPGVVDVRWDNPSILARNTSFTIVGVNVYRSDVSDRGPFIRINEFPLGGSFYRDQTDNVLIVDETVTDWVFEGDAPNDRRWVFRTQYPIVKRDPEAPFQKPTPANAPEDVIVTIDGEQAAIESVFGPSGEVGLVNLSTFNLTTEKDVSPVLPVSGSAVSVTYYANKNHVRSGLGAAIFYRLTTVALDTTKPSGYIETDLSWCKPAWTGEVETLDYIWREAIRRNGWILQQGGERAKIFVRRQSGVPCQCGMDPMTLEYDKQPRNRCLLCYGTGFLGGYDGPFDTIIAPDDGERRIAQLAGGRRLEHTYEVFMGPSPVVTQRDFIVKQTNERYSIGPSRRPSNRGNFLQQHFTVAYLDEGDIRYKVPIDGTSSLTWPQTRLGFRQAPSMPVDGELSMPPSTMPDKPAYPIGASAQIPMETEKTGTPDNVEQRGRTETWENQNS